MNRLRRAVVLLAFLCSAVGCSAEPIREGAPATAATSSPEAPATATAPTSPPSTAPDRGSEPAPSGGRAVPQGCDGGAVVEVSGAAQLQDALDAAAPGQTIRLSAGTYPGTFVATAAAPPRRPIVLCGGRDAILDGGDIEGDYTLHLKGASNWHLRGFTVTGGMKGVMVDAGTGHRIEDLLITSVGDEAIHLRTHSSGNTVAGNVVRDTGLRKPAYGEGIYIGSAESNWCSLTACRPDRSDRNVIVANDISGTTAEAVDIKEGTTGGVLRDNVFDGSAMVEADSWVDVKGNDWLIQGNRGTASASDGFQVHEVVDAWGRGTVFRGNEAADVGGLAINAAGNRELRGSTTVFCDNTAVGPGELSNVACSPG